MNLTDDTMRAAVAKAVLEALPPEHREKLLVDAIKGLMEPAARPSGYGNHPPQSVLEQAFHFAVTTVAREQAVAMLRSDDHVRELVTTMITKVVERLMVNVDALAEKAADLIGDSIAKGARGY